MKTNPPLRPLHPDSSLIPSKLEKYEKLSTDALVDSLRLGQDGALKTRPDGTIVDGHHRLKILKGRAREIVPHA